MVGVFDYVRSIGFQPFHNPDLEYSYVYDSKWGSDNNEHAGGVGLGFSLSDDIF